ncbi:MAG: hypothetical protein NTV51_29275 [Verrucomicrobia bacterium]|nr:hypothetical protein [Verrucomicrobiota bacterium]
MIVRFRPALLFALPVLTWAAAAADESAKPAEPAKKSGESQWVFSLLPKSFQKNPQLDLTVITEMTAAGKKRPPVSPAKPAYFIAQSGGYRALGHAPGREKTLSPEQVEKILTHALAANGYLPAKAPATAPSVAIMFVWGSHNLLVEGDDENPSLSGNQVARNLLDRAALVGGEKFAKEMLELFVQADSMAMANPPARIDPSGTVPGIEPILGAAQLEFANPVNLFKLKSAKNEFLLDQTAADVYYVVASAYDYSSLAKNQRVLLWRTRMTVAAQGVSQEQTLPTLIASAAPFFGKEMSEPEILTRRPVREGTVDVGVPTVVESGVPAPVPAPKKK